MNRSQRIVRVSAAGSAKRLDEDGAGPRLGRPGVDRVVDVAAVGRVERVELQHAVELGAVAILEHVVRVQHLLPDAVERHPVGGPALPLGVVERAPRLVAEHAREAEGARVVEVRRLPRRALDPRVEVAARPPPCGEGDVVGLRHREHRRTRRPARAQDVRPALHVRAERGEHRDLERAAGPAPVIAGGPTTVTVGAALLLDGAVTTTREPGWSTASTSACWRCVGARVPASRSCRASSARARPRLETAGLPPASWCAHVLAAAPRAASGRFSSGAPPGTDRVWRAGSGICAKGLRPAAPRQPGAEWRPEGALG